MMKKECKNKVVGGPVKVAFSAVSADAHRSPQNKIRKRKNKKERVRV